LHAARERQDSHHLLVLGGIGGLDRFEGAIVADVDALNRVCRRQERDSEGRNERSVHGILRA